MQVLWKSQLSCRMLVTIESEENATDLLSIVDIEQPL